MKRVFLIVLDSCGIGAAPDAGAFGDAGVNTLRSCAESPFFSMPNLISMGLGQLDGVDYLPKAAPKMAMARLQERSMGKDTTIGHWELAGIVSEQPLPTYPEGFPQEVLDEFSRQTGRGVLCNLPYSGTEVIKDYGEEHLKTGDLIVYTSADSVFQIAAHESIVPPEQLYEYCRTARSILRGRHGVGRVIARPFEGEWPFTRTSRRHDFSLEPPERTVLDAITDAGLDMIAVGKIHDIFAGRGMTEFTYTTGNPDGLKKTLELADRDFRGLCFVNLVDFDMLYGHRRDPDGYAKALAEFDAWLPGFLQKLGPEDVLLVTADHGCDPRYLKHTDHTREFIPMLAMGPGVKPGNLGTRTGFCDIAATVAELLGVSYETPGQSFAAELTGAAVRPEELIAQAMKAMERAYCPYSGYKVGAALLAKSGKVYPGCNIENAAFGPTNCAERTAFFTAVCQGEREFSAIAVVGGKDGAVTDIFPPCGVCRQVMAEFCGPDFRIYMGRGDGSFEAVCLKDLLPYAFSAGEYMQNG